MADVAPGLQGVRAEALQIAPVRVFGVWLLLTAGFGALAARQQPISAKGPAFVDITWIAIANVMYELGTSGG